MQCADLAMVFPGQGSQSVGMMKDLADAFAVVQETFDQASSVLGYDLWARVQDGPPEALNQTVCTQPAMLAAGVATWRCWTQKSDTRPALMAGHSLGEYTALVCAGAIEFEQAVALVRERATCMQNAVPEGSGAMAAILGLDDGQVQAVCEEAARGQVVSAVNFNAPGQVVIAGDTAAVDRAVDLARQAGAKRALPLPVSVPSHCSLMKPAAQAFGEALAHTTLRAPSIAVLHNVDVSRRDTPEAIRAALSAQLYSPVLWVDTVRAMHAGGVTRVLEMGPGKVLAGLGKRIEKSLPCTAIQNAGDIDNALADLG